MITGKLTYDNEWIVLDTDNAQELNQIKNALTMHIPNWFILIKKNPHINVTETFINEYRMIPVGLWLQVVYICQKYNIVLKFDDDFNCRIKDCNLSRIEYDQYIDSLFKNSEKIKPRDYQRDAVFNILNYKRCCIEISTSGGKTLISYMLFRYFIDILELKHILFITPKTNLTTQSGDKFYEYDCGNKLVSNWSCAEIHAKAPKKKVYDDTIIFGNYQSLCRKKPEFFEQFDAVIEDECLVPDTLISMADDSKKKICDVKIGDLVWTYNEYTENKEIHEVEYVYHNLSINEKLYEVKFSSGKLLHITGNHKIFVPIERGYWKRVDELDLDEDFVFNELECGEYIESIKEIEQVSEVYNLRIKSSTEYNHNYFANGICVSNCHHGTATSLKQIRRRCTNAKYFVGMTGTFPKEDTYENLLLQSYLGPVVYRLSSHELINKVNSATPVHVAVFEMKYLDKDTKNALYNLRRQKDKSDPTAGNNILKLEKEVMRRDKIRFKYICDMISKTTKNSLAIFSDVQNEYGRKIYEYIKESSDKNVYYIDGNTPTNNREYYKAQMENDTEGNTIIVASTMCFSEGIDIANLWNIFLLESTKSETVIAQLLGRGMRQFPGKDKTMMIDFVDDFRTGQGWQAENYLYRHGKERQAIYKKRGFPYKVFNVELLPNSTPLVND